MAAPNDTPAAPSPLGWRIAALGLLSATALLAFVVLAYQVALARVPQHRAALERLVRTQTGLDLRFGELTLRWGWYGPEAVFRHVELGEPESGEVLLRAPQLVVEFDTWRTLRSGQPEAGRIELTAPDIELVAPARNDRRFSAPDRRATLRPGLARVALLRRWRGGRVDIEGGTLNLPAADGTEAAIRLQIRQASLRHADDEWSVDGVVLLPERMGRSVRIVARVSGDVGAPSLLSGSVRLTARRLAFAGWRELVAVPPPLESYVPLRGGGDLALNMTFEQGMLVTATGSVHAGGLLWPGRSRGTQASLERLRGDWRLVRRGDNWRLQVNSLELDDSDRRAALTLDAGPAGQWVRGSLDGAPLPALLSLARCLIPGFDLAGIELDGVVQRAGFDWDTRRMAGQRLQSWGRLAEVRLEPASHDFTLSGFDVRVQGSESRLQAQLRSRTALLELTQSRQFPLPDVHVDAAIQLDTLPGGWILTTQAFTLEQRHARLTLSGSLRSDVSRAEPELTMSGSLQGADVAFMKRLLGASTDQAFGAVAAQLTAGNIEAAHFQLRGPLSELPFGRGLFTGSLVLRRGVLSGGDLWPDAAGIAAHVQWHGAQIHATIDSAAAGPFQLAPAQAEWDAAGERATRLSGRVSGRLEDTLAWVRAHPRLQEFVPGIAEIAASGPAAFDFDVSIPVTANGSQVAANNPVSVPQSAVQARVATRLEHVELQAVAGLPPLHAVSGSFVFDGGRLQHSSLAGRWLGGPLVLDVGERHDKGKRVLAIQARGVLSATRLAGLANAGKGVEGNSLPDVHGNASWSGELDFEPPDATRPGAWRMHADSDLLGFASSLPAPFAKRAATAAPLHLELAGSDASAQLRVRFADRLHATLALRSSAQTGWSIDRGAVAFGNASMALPAERVLLIQGRIAELDLPASALAWQRLRRESVPPIEVRVLADTLRIGGARYPHVALQGRRTDAGTELLLDSAALGGEARWPNPATATAPAAVDNWVTAMSAYWQGGARSPAPAQVHLTQIMLDPAAQTPAPPAAGALRWVAAALGPSVQIAVDRIVWHGRTLGRLTARLSARADDFALENVQLLSDTHDGRAELHCEPNSMACRLTFLIESSDAAGTLADFGFRPDLTGSAASLSGAVHWQPVPGQSWLGGFSGTLHMGVQEGAIRPATSPSAVASTRVDQMSVAENGKYTNNPQNLDDGRAIRHDSDFSAPVPFALFAVPALVGALEDSGAPLGTPVAGDPAPAAASPAGPAQLRFTQLTADFQLRNGEARTSNLYFDGDAEILMRGRTGLLARDYDQQVWVLRGEERLPAAIRRFGATPRIAAAWLSLRQLFTGETERDRSRAALHLQGSWQAPIVVAGN